ncbi:MAG: tetratricopeptide repeat protein [Rhodospirillaceae bacterium]
MQDLRGLALTAASEDAVKVFNSALAEWLDYRVSAMPTLKGALELDPGFCMAHCFRGYMLMLFSSVAVMGGVKGALEKAQAASAGANERERRHVDALAQWAAGDPRGACARWEAILADHPLDILALRLHHFTSFWLGHAVQLYAVPAAVLPAWDKSLPNYGNVLGMIAFGLEENAQYEAAERYGREAVERNPDDMWSIHAVAHVLEMQQRFEEGLDWLDYPLDQWDDRNPFRGHVWWHGGLYVIEAGRYDEALALYDSSIHDTTTEFYMDMHNSASFLARLGFRGVDVGKRWAELADSAKANKDGHARVFADIHLVMALARTKRFDDAEAYIASMRAVADKGDTHTARVLGRVGVPLCQAIVDFERGDDAGALAAMIKLKPKLREFGASNAQRDLIYLYALEAAKRAGDTAQLDFLMHERRFMQGIARRAAAVQAPA